MRNVVNRALVAKKKLFALFAAVLMATSMWGTTAYVSTYDQLRSAISNTSVDNIIVTANIDVPCGNSGNAGQTDLTGASTAQLIIDRSLILQSQAGSKFVIKRTSAGSTTSHTLKSLIAIRGDGHSNGGEQNRAENTVEVSFTNIIIDGGANFGNTSVCDRHSAAVDAYGNAGRAMIDVYLGGVLNLEDGAELRNGYTTKSDNSLLNDNGTSQCFGGAVRVDYHNQTGGGTINVKAGAYIHDCATYRGYGGALGAYNYARLNLYGGTISNCCADHGGAIACTYRSANDYGDASAGTIRMYGGTISSCCAIEGGALCTHGPVHDYILGGTITGCSATDGGAIFQKFSTTVLHIVAYSSGKLTISSTCSNTHETSTGSTDGYHYIYLSTDSKSSGSISITPVYQVTFRNNNSNFAVLSVVQSTSLGEAFPAAPVNADFRFVGWYNGNTEVTKNTLINTNTTVTAKWDFLGSGTSSDPYLIPSTDAWDTLAHRVTRGNTFSGKYFSQTANISITTMAGDVNMDSKPFEGTYDGNGRTFDVNLDNIKSNSECTAPFIYLNNATIKNMHITGSVSTTKVRPASIASFVGGNTTITNCRSAAAISSSGYYADNYKWVDAGAFVARVNSGKTLTLNGCLFTGSISYSNAGAYEGGGMVGWTQDNAHVTLNDCVFAPSAINVTNHNAFKMFVGGNAQGILNNCYYNDVANSSGLEKEGKHMYSITAGTGVTAALAGTTTTYDVSGIAGYGSSGSNNGIKYNNVLYGGKDDAISLNLSGSSNYKASAGTLTGSSNPYSLTMPASNVTIYGAASVSAAPSANNLTYTGTEQALVSAGTPNGGTMYYSTDNSTWSTSIPTATNAADDYVVYYKVVGDAMHADFIPSPNTVNVTINKAPLSITADNKQVVYLQDAPTYTATYDGFVNSETESVLTGSLAYTCTYSSGNALGDYAITPSGLSSNNYAITFNDGTLQVVSPAAIVLPDNEDKTSLLAALNNQTLNITIGRTIYAGPYNTFCLPFSMSAEQIAASPLQNAILKDYNGADVTGTGAERDLNIHLTDLTEIEAGKPFLVKTETNIENPTFNDVIITYTGDANGMGQNIVADYVDFQGLLAPFDLAGTYQSSPDYLGVGMDGRLYWADATLSTAKMRAFRAFFHVKEVNAQNSPVRRGMHAQFVEDAPQTPTGVEPVTGNPSPVTEKIFRNGILYILRDGKTYNAQGQELE